jgi:hypothetical protein
MMLLILDVVFHCVFVDTESRDIVASCPERAFGEFLCFLFDPGGGFGFENLDGVGYGILWRDDDVKMDMFVSNVPLDNL